MASRHKDEVGNVYGLLTVVKRGENRGTRATWLCRCGCGNPELVQATGTALRDGTSYCCGCAFSTRLDDLRGQTFGSLTVIERGPGFRTEVGWLCHCSCGNVQLVHARASQLKKGVAKDCGYCEPFSKGIYGPFIDRKTAEQKGYPYCFPGNLCRKGHLGARSTKTGACLTCKAEQNAQLRAEGYFREYEAIRRETDPSWKAEKARVARESYHRHKDDEGAKEKRKAWYEKHKKTDWYKQSTKAAKERFAKSGKKAEADKRYSKSAAGKTSHDKARKQWLRKFEEERGMPISTWRLQNDEQFKLHCRLNTRISDALKKQGMSKDTKTSELIDARVSDFKAYLSANWEDGMDWDNYGRHGWHIDHIRPCASFDLTDVDQQLVCFNWRNLRPLWADENISKGDSYDHQDEEDWSEMMRDLGFEGDLFLIYS